MAPNGTPQEVIYFYLAQDDYGYFSNFSRHSIFLKGKRWPTSEHYFQAQKFSGTPIEEKIRCADKPGEAANLGRSRAHPLRKDWEEVKEDIMREALVAKFTQRKELRAALLATCGKLLVEHTHKDSYWGDGGDGSGKNRLGYLLMEVRDQLSGETTAIPATLPTPNATSTPATKSENGESGTSEDSGEGDEEGGSGEEGETIEGVEPNENHLHSAPNVAGAAPKVVKKGRNKRERKARATRERSVFRDEDGTSKIEKTTGTKGSVTVIGDGTVFSEKALPPQAKSVVNKHQMQRKYHPTEKDLEEDEEDEASVPTRPNNNFISEFVDRSIVYAPEEIEEAEAMQLAMVASIQEREEEEKRKKEEEQREKREKEIVECVEAAKANLELLSSLTTNDEELLATVQTACVGLRNTMSKYITELTELDNTEQLALVMEQFVKLQTAC